jgi:hypothetical protein
VAHYRSYVDLGRPSRVPDATSAEFTFLREPRLSEGSAATYHSPSSLPSLKPTIAQRPERPGLHAIVKRIRTRKRAGRQAIDNSTIWQNFVGSSASSH